jgi:ubiquinone/menaquinone biosynthesis C-methylase UbiE
MSSITDPTKRFANRVENYVKYRPDYPHDIISFLKNELSLDSSWIIADVGSGTGILSKMFLENGNTVLGVEPNKEMREAAENILRDYSKFKSIDGTAESSSIEENSVDLITAAQAFHWFNLEKSKKEFKRILRNNGWIVLIWNERKTEETQFLKEYENLLNNFSVDYKLVDHRRINDHVLNKFFKDYTLKVFPNFQEFSFDGLEGRLLSSSYVPTPDHPNYKPMMKALSDIFNRYNLNGKVKFEYKTKLYYGKI